MKKLMFLFILVLPIISYSQNYMSHPYEVTEPSSSINIELMQRVLQKKQSDYDNSKKIACQSLMKHVIGNAEYNEFAEIEYSSMLTSASYYRLNGLGYVFVVIKHSNGEYPYIYCGISKERWDYFVNGGKAKSWGESFNFYISNYKCDCL